MSDYTVPLKTCFNINIIDLENREKAMILGELIDRKLEEPKYNDRLQAIINEAKEDVILNTPITPL
jgi:hypothetical protein